MENIKMNKWEIKQNIKITQRGKCKNDKRGKYYMTKRGKYQITKIATILK